jgi:ABC-type uncharacterized transport system permease subunit
VKILKMALGLLAALYALAQIGLLAVALFTERGTARASSVPVGLGLALLAAAISALLFRSAFRKAGPQEAQSAPGDRE